MDVDELGDSSEEAFCADRLAVRDRLAVKDSRLFRHLHLFLQGTASRPSIWVLEFRSGFPWRLKFAGIGEADN